MQTEKVLKQYIYETKEVIRAECHKCGNHFDVAYKKDKAGVMIALADEATKSIKVGFSMTNIKWDKFDGDRGDKIALERINAPVEKMKVPLTALDEMKKFLDRCAKMKRFEGYSIPALEQWEAIKVRSHEKAKVGMNKTVTFKETI